jgi:hypothetical protein
MLLAPAFAMLVLTVSSTADVSPSLVDRVVDEANAIWKPAGITLVRQRSDDRTPASISLTIGRERGSVHPYDTPLGWTEFESGQPQPWLYLSYANAVALFESARGIVGSTTRMPILERETYLGRAMGRALAHEVGHYLLAARLHTANGLMKANFTAVELFMPDTRHFAITDAQRSVATARLVDATLLASTTSGSSSPTSRRPASTPRGAARWQGPIQD